MTYANNDTFEGEWVNDAKQTGHSKMTTAAGVYEGKCLGDMKNGKGVMKYANGDTYSGDWKNDKRHGTGCLTLKSKAKASGTWKDDIFIED